MSRSAPNVYGPALRAAVKETKALLAGLRHPMADAVVERVATTAISTYLASRDPSRGQQIAASTRAMAGMAVGDEIEIRALAPQNIRCNMLTARKISGIPTSTWQMELIEPGRYKVRRLANGARPMRQALQNPKALKLAAIPLGAEHAVASFRNAKDVQAHYKAIARLLLGEPAAQWKARTTPQGVMVRRIR